MQKIRQAIEEFRDLPSRNKIGALAFLFFLFLFAFFVTIFYWRMRTPRPSSPSQTPPPVTKKEPALATLSLVPENQTVKAGSTFLVTINFKTGDYKVDTVDAVLSFDPKLLAVEKISPGMFFAEYPIKKWQDGQVMLTGTIGAQGKQTGGAKGEGALGTIKFKALTPGSASVRFAKNSLVVTKGKNVLGKTKGAVFEIY